MDSFGSTRMCLIIILRFRTLINSLYITHNTQSVQVYDQLHGSQSSGSRIMLPPMNGPMGLPALPSGRVLQNYMSSYCWVQVSSRIGLWGFTSLTLRQGLTSLHAYMLLETLNPSRIGLPNLPVMPYGMVLRVYMPTYYWDTTLLVEIYYNIPLKVRSSWFTIHSL